CIYITTIVERYPNYLTGEFIRYLDGSLGFISQLKSVGAFTHRLNGKTRSYRTPISPCSLVSSSKKVRDKFDCEIELDT
ncbi:hypothetical protein, partial [Coleofasciculus sp. G2-EDA-02]|uniref:hypothetical protein n=1 Tax=unclassified Coleofasciculus TaxID=2692782 RepID=UPI0032F0C4E4